MRDRGLVVVMAACLFVACTADGEGGPTSNRPTSTNPTNRVEKVPFHVVGYPPPPRKRCSAPSREAGGYAVLIGPTGGKPGSTVVMGGYTPLFNEAGHYTGPSGKIGFWFNLPFDDWPLAYSLDGPSTSNGTVPVIHLGEANVNGQCSYRVTFKVPSVPPGVYDIVPIEHSGKPPSGASAFLPVAFRVTG